MEQVNSIVEKIKSDGVVVVPDYFTAEYCDKFTLLLDSALEQRLSNGSVCGNDANQVLDNYFMDEPDLVELFVQDLTDQVMRKMIDDDYVLLAPSARNRRVLAQKSFGKRTAGMGWHTDSRFIQGGQGLKPSLCYMTIVCLDDFTRQNGATHYVPGSHKKYERPHDRDADLDYEVLECPKGSLVIFDTALWHRVGTGNHQSRWGVFNTYGPWFIKPY